DVEKAVAISLNQEFPFPLAEDGVNHHRIFIGIPIMGVMRSKLKVPFQLAGIWIERKNTAGVKIIASSGRTVIVRCGIADGPKKGMGLHIVCPGHPRRAPTVIGRIVCPSRSRRISLAGNRPEPPQEFSGGSIVGVNETVDRAFSPGLADEDFAVYC